MNYLTETRRNALAAEYVLGTLRGGARRRYQQLIMSNQLIAETTWLWEQYLNGMGEQVAPIVPDEALWQRIQEKLGFISAASTDKAVVQRPGLWRTPAVLALAASILIAVVWTSLSPVPPAPATHIAVVNNQQSAPLWLIEVSDKRLRIRATDQLSSRPDKDFELWIVPDNGTGPVSLGLLPKQGELAVAAPDSLKTVPINVLAVSLEPLGGSPTGQPTEVLFTANLIAV